MTSEKHDREAESLGQFLKKARIAQGLELEQIGEETRISSSNLKAMEADDYGALPADAFTRGFYSLYAKRLKLDPSDIIARFKAERGAHPRKDAVISHNPPAHKAAQQVSNMAEPSYFSPLSTIGYILLLLIILGGGICWHFNINPATYISEKLRSLQEEDVPKGPAGDVDNSGAGQQDAAGNAGQGATSAIYRSGTINLAFTAGPVYSPAMTYDPTPCMNNPGYRRNSSAC